MTEPLTPTGCDLRDFPHTPVFRARLFGSSFHARANDGEWRAGVTLWLKSWDQMPAGSLPDDEIELCRLAELARDLRTWRKVKEGALRGWVKCTDGRLYHPVVAEGVNNAIAHKAAQRSKTAKARLAALEKHLAKATDAADRARITDEIRRLKQSLSQNDLPPVTDSDTESKGREEKGEGRDIDSEANASAADGGNDPPDEPPTTPKPKVTDPNEIIFGYGVPLLTVAGSTDKHARSFLAGLRKAHGDDALIGKLRECVRAKPLQPLEWLAKALPPPETGKHAGFATKDYREGVDADGSLA